MHDMFLLKDDEYGPLYVRSSALATARVIPPSLRLPDRKSAEVEIYYVSGLREFITEADWKRIQPLLMSAESDLWAALEVALAEGLELGRKLSDAQQRIHELEDLLDTEESAQLMSAEDFQTLLQADVTNILTQPAETPTPVVSPPIAQNESPHEDTIEACVIKVERADFDSKTSGSRCPMWRMTTDTGLKVNAFDHADPLRDHKPLLEQAGYLAFFQSMTARETVFWMTHPIRVAMTANGRFWELQSIGPRTAEAVPDALSLLDALTPEQVDVCREAKALLEKDPIIFDSETTGLRNDDEIVQFAGVTAQGSLAFCELVKPMDLSKLRRPGRGGRTSVDIHGIDETMLKEAYTIGDESCQMGWICITYLHGKVWAAFNIDYDVRLLRQSWALDGCLPESFPVAQEMICVQQLMNRYIGHEYTSLDEACKFLGIQRNETHRADADARDTATILQALAAKVPAENVERAEL